MKKYLSRIVVFTLSLLFFNVANAAAEKYIFDPQHSYVSWQISHFGFSNPSGKWMIEGTLWLDQQKPQNSKVNATINVTNFITGIPELDKHLQGELFFDTEKYPTATFVSNKVDLLGNNKALVHGILTLHGISKPITLNIQLNKIGENPINNKMGVGFSGNTTLKRSDFDIITLLPGLGDEVKIHIEAEAYR